MPSATHDSIRSGSMRPEFSRTTRTCFDFKWADNLQHPGDIMDFYISGDVAPDAGLVAISGFGALNADFLGSPRLFFAMADDGLFFKAVAADAGDDVQKQVATVAARHFQENAWNRRTQRPSPKSWMIGRLNPKG